ncbi:hypothetical protein PR048_012366 [Dryococelus australis]|uniref:Uncharacterized protein n=1 Tax=Dryococelus australis TaxID=614101 RepID=A0ABQ9HP72_9NEOP|nr:hypothetical protein PR048_012366 [Dryococelus australis]
MESAEMSNPKLNKLDAKHAYTEVTFTIGSQFLRHALDNSESIVNLQGNKCRVPYCQSLDHTVFDTYCSTLAQSSPSTVTADIQCAVNIGIFARKTAESRLQIIELANFPVDDVDTLRNRIEEGCETISNTIGIHQRIRESMRRQVDACSNHRSQDGQQLNDLAVTQSGGDRSPWVSGAMLSVVRPTTVEGYVTEETGDEHDDRDGPTYVQLD